MLWSGLPKLECWDLIVLLEAALGDQCKGACRSMVAYHRSDCRDVRSIRSGCMTVEQWSTPWSLFSCLKQDEIRVLLAAIVTALQAARDRALSDFRNGRVSARHPSLDIPARVMEKDRGWTLPYAAVGKSSNLRGMVTIFACDRSLPPSSLGWCCTGSCELSPTNVEKGRRLAFLVWQPNYNVIIIIKLKTIEDMKM